MRESPQEDEAVTLIADMDTDRHDDSAVVDAVEAAGATVEKELPFNSLQITIQQDAIDDLCSIDALTSLKTDNAIGFAGDAGEDV